MRTLIVAILLLGAANLACSREQQSTLVPPTGFRVAIFAENVSGARSLTLSPNGTVFVSTRGEGKIYALKDADRDGKADAVITVAKGLNLPNGIAFKDGSLYVAEATRLLRYDDIEARLNAPGKPVVLRDDFPKQDRHRWKYLAFGPDGKLYMGIGAPCNICFSEDPRFASVVRMNPDGSGEEVIAHGVRNTIGFAWHPVTGEFWFTDNGRDEMGDDLPPDELNFAPRSGMHFGYPFCHAGDIPDPEFGSKRPCSEFTPPAIKLAPHTAALGMRFYTGKMFPEAYRNQIFIAEHGSWNRSRKIGYRVSLVKLEGNRAVAYQPFLEGFLSKDETVSGRPVDVLVMPDGALLVSDDQGGVIYRISYGA